MDGLGSSSNVATADADDASAVSPSGDSTVEIDINGAALLLDRSGAVYWPDRAALIVADLHFEKGSAFAARGRFLPPYDTANTIDRLRRVIGRYRPKQVWCLGDSFHDPSADHRISQTDLDQLTDLIGRQDWVWISGNHDPDPMSRVPGETVADLHEGPLVLRHEAKLGGAGDLSGHFHPTAWVATRARRVRRRCFVHDANRLILPAFGAYAGGLNILSDPIRKLFGGRISTWLVGDRRLYAVPGQRLLRDPSGPTVIE
ncbi:MAG: ligase-associated DNA damage response endonuclease PdeM [Pseudomonadota bacterium]